MKEKDQIAVAGVQAVAYSTACFFKSVLRETEVIVARVILTCQTIKEEKRFLKVPETITLLHWTAYNHLI